MKKLPISALILSSVIFSATTHAEQTNIPKTVKLQIKTFSSADTQIQEKTYTFDVPNDNSVHYFYYLNSSSIVRQKTSEPEMVADIKANGMDKAETNYFYFKQQAADKYTKVDVHYREYGRVSTTNNSNCGFSMGTSIYYNNSLVYPKTGYAKEGGFFGGCPIEYRYTITLE